MEYNKIKIATLYREKYSFKLNPFSSVFFFFFFFFFVIIIIIIILIILLIVK